MPRIGDARSQRLFYQPYSSGSKRQSRNIADSDTTVTLVAGDYEGYLATASLEGASAKIGGAATVPADDAAEGEGFMIPPNAPFTFVMKPGETALHCIMNLSGASGKLRLTRQP